MADEYKMEPNATWPPQRYYDLGVYVYLFNAIANDTGSFGLEKSNGDQYINQYIKDCIKAHLADPSTPVAFMEELKKSGADIHISDLSKFLADFDNLVAKAKDYSAVKHSDGGHLNGMITNEEMAAILHEKRKQVREYHENVRLRAKSDANNYENDGKTKNGVDAEAYDKAKRELSKMNSGIRRNDALTVLKGAGTALLAAGTIFSAGAFLAVGGAALGSIFGSIYAASSVGTAVLGVGGTIGGGFLTKHLAGKFLQDLATGRELRRKRRAFKKSYDFDEKGMKGFKDAEYQYYLDLAIQKRLEKGDKAFSLVDKNGKRLKGFERRQVKGMIKAWKRANREGKIGLDSVNDKNISYYQFVTDFFDESKGNYNFDYLKAKLASAKSMNVNDGLSVQGRTLTYEDALNGSLSLEQLKKYVRDLKGAENSFSGDSHEKYEELMYRFSDKIVDSFHDGIFENTYTNQTLTNMSDAFDDETIKERLKDTKLGSSESNVNNALKFMTMIEPQLDGSVGASVKNQVKITKTNIEDAVQKLGMDASDPDFARVQTIAENIENASSKSDAASFTADIASLPNGKVKDYLEFISGKKEKGLVHNAATLSGAIPAVAADIASLSNMPMSSKLIPDELRTFNSKVESIKRQITNSTASDNDKKATMELLNEQVRALEEQRKLAYTSGMLDVVEDNGYDKFGELAEDISKITGYASSECTPLMLKFRDVKPVKVANFLIYRLNDKVFKNLKTELENTEKYNGTSKDVLGNITKFLTSLASLEKGGYIRPAQKLEIMNTMNVNIENAVEQLITTTKKNFVLDYDQNVFDNLLTESFASGGLKEYFEEKTVSSEKLKKRIDYMSTLSSVKKMIEAPVGGQKLKDSENEARAFSLIYLGNKDERTNGDSLYDSLGRMDRIHKDSLSGGTLTFDDATPIEESFKFVKDMNSEISRIMSFTDDYDKYAALIVLKKRCIAMYKTFVDKFYLSKNVNDRESYLRTPANLEEFERQVYNKWCHPESVVNSTTGLRDKGIMNKIDEAIATCSHLDIYRKYSPMSAVESIGKSKDSTTAAQYRGPEM